jgi:putative addiction module component (TIGR02574 family)
MLFVFLIIFSSCKKNVYFSGIKIGELNMSSDLKQCEAHALKLALKDRAILAERLISSLDSLGESENEQLWVEEAQRRYKGYRKGKITARPTQDVLREARAAIK